MLYTSLGRFDEALQVLTQAYAIDPVWPALPALETFTHFCSRNFKEAVISGARAVEIHPYLPLGRSYYAQALDYAGKRAEALEQHRLACTMSPDIPWLRALLGICLAKGRNRSDVEVILDELAQVRDTVYVDAYYMAALHLALGRREDALRELERAVEENSATLDGCVEG